MPYLTEAILRENSRRITARIANAQTTVIDATASGLRLPLSDGAASKQTCGMIANVAVDSSMSIQAQHTAKSILRQEILSATE